MTFHHPGNTFLKAAINRGFETNIPRYELRTQEFFLTFLFCLLNSVCLTLFTHRVLGKPRTDFEKQYIKILFYWKNTFFTYYPDKFKNILLSMLKSTSLCMANLPWPVLQIICTFMLNDPSHIWNLNFEHGPRASTICTMPIKWPWPPPFCMTGLLSPFFINRSKLSIPTLKKQRKNCMI